MASLQRLEAHGQATLIRGDARTLSDVESGWAQLVVTSPPYANNFDYADATRLEMSFLREIESWGDLQEAVRKHLVRSCSQHASSRSSDEAEVALADPILARIAGPLSAAFEELEELRLTRGGRKTYSYMVALYFRDMAQMWKSLRTACAEGARVCFVVGDSAPYGVHIPVDRWLGELAVANGFSSYSFEKTRDRNTKWRNRKHRVPLHEGRLWIEG